MSITLLTVNGPSACDVARLCLAFGPYLHALTPCLADIDAIRAAYCRLVRFLSRPK